MTSIDFTNTINTFKMFQVENNILSAGTIKNKFDDLFNELKDNIDVLNFKINDYANQLSLYNSLKEIYNTYSDMDLKKNTDKAKKGITNDRKSYYEAQEYDNLISWYSTFWWIYYILAITCSLIIFLSISPDTISFTFKCIISVFIFAYPFIISYIIFPFVALYNFLYHFFPKNVYKSI